MDGWENFDSKKCARSIADWARSEEGEKELREFERNAENEAKKFRGGWMFWPVRKSRSGICGR